jgi:spore coat polysaccharide biosynthesis protein SpsF
MKLAIIQARMGSNRLPGKVLRPLVGKPMLQHIAERVARARTIEKVVVATSDRPADDAIATVCETAGLPCFRGSESDVLDRFWRAAKAHGGDPVLRITGDCPFADPDLIDRLFDVFAGGDLDHCGVATGAGAAKAVEHRWPDGLDAEWMRFEALDRAHREATEPLDREHVTPFLWRNKHIFRTGLMFAPADYSRLRWTVDNEADFTFVRSVYEALYSPERPFLLADILRLLGARPELAAVNASYVGHEGYDKLHDLPLSEGGHERR